MSLPNTQALIDAYAVYTRGNAAYQCATQVFNGADQTKPEFMDIRKLLIESLEGCIKAAQEILKVLNGSNSQ